MRRTGAAYGQVILLREIAEIREQPMQGRSPFF
jgi:hypothetical protein